MQRTLEITNCYELYDDVVVTKEVDVKLPGEFGSEQEYEDYLYDLIFPLTGVGHEDGNSMYFVESTDGLEPEINEEF